MALRLEITGVPHPFKLCMFCNDALGETKITIEPGHPSQRDIFSCHDHLGRLLHDFGEAVVTRLREEKGKEDG